MSADVEKAVDPEKAFDDFPRRLISVDDSGREASMSPTGKTVSLDESDPEIVKEVVRL